MISIKKLIPILIIISNNALGNISKDNSQISNLIFSNIKEKKIEINEVTNLALSLEILLPKKVVQNELEKFYNNLGKFKKEKKVITCDITSKGESLSFFSTIEKNKKKVMLNISDGKELMSRISLTNVLDSFKKILIRRFLNDYIKKVEDSISKIDKIQNRIIRNNPKKLEMNIGFSYNIYQRNESKKISLKSSLESLYEELDRVKIQYNSIK
tara:strand:- start:2632 stop:3270 length:639 start_codon:yes stop_codon:yes gene_type:complete